MNIPRRALAFPIVAAGVVATVWFVLRDGAPGAVLDVSGTVEATEAALGFQLPGRIAHIAVLEGDRVQSGDLIAELDRAELQARLRSARLQAEAAYAQLRELQAGSRQEEIGQGEAAVHAARSRAEEARREDKRAQRLYDGGAISARERDRAETAIEVAETDLQRAVEQLALLEQGPRPEQVSAQRARAAQADAMVEQLEATLDHATVRAPFDGVVAVRHREPGESIGAGAPVVTLRNLDERWVRVFVPETNFGRLAVGTTAEIRVDPFPDRRFAGVVSFMADEAEFTPRTVQTPEERVKLVFRVKVRITDDSTFALKPGLPADVRFALDLNEP